MEHSEQDAPYLGGSTATIDPDYGQRGAFPGLGDVDEEEMFYGPASDGLEYLRMVRLEAQSVPKLLSIQGNASNPVRAADIDGDNDAAQYHAGSYGEGLLDHKSGREQSDGSSETEDDTQDLYYKALMNRFLRFRDHISNCPASMSGRSGGTLPKALQQQSRKLQWSYELKHTSPTSSSFVSATQADVLRGLIRVQSLLTRTTMMATQEQTNLACWSWALLGRCRDVGTLDSEDVSVLRDLAKTALALASNLERSRGRSAMSVDQASPSQDISEPSHRAGTQPADDMDDLEDGELRMDTDAASEKSEGEISATDDLEETRSAMLEKLQGMSADRELASATGTGHGDIEERVANALMTLDIIVTIVGSVFGQRDLLESRIAWQ